VVERLALVIQIQQRLEADVIYNYTRMQEVWLDR
jgi:hypothetical protein